MPLWKQGGKEKIIMENWDEQKRDTSLTFFTKGIKTLWYLIGLGGERKNLTIVFLWLVVLTTLGLLFPYLLKLIFDELPNVINTKQINNYLIGIIITMFALKGVSIYFNRFFKEIRLLKSLIKLENFWPAVAQEKLLALSLGYHEKENTGSKISKIEKGCTKTLEILMNIFWGFLPQLLYLLINIVFILIINWKLGLLYFLPFIPAIWLNIKCFDKFAPIWKKWDEKKEISSGIFCQSLINVSTVQGFVQEKREASSFSGIRKEMENLDLSASIKIQRYLFGVGLILNSFFVLTIIAGIYFIYSGEETIGTIVYIIATGNVAIESVWELTHAYNKIIKDLISVIRMKILLDEKLDIKSLPNAIIPRHYEGNFEFQNVSFVYPCKNESVLKEINLNISPNQMIALVSKTGEGKTTVIRLLCRMYDKISGEIKLDGKNIKDIDLFWYRRLFAIVQQDVDIFDTSILDNVKYPYPNAATKQVTEAVRAAHLQVVIDSKSRFPNGINTQVGERGVRLSGGEKQRVGIARAYLALLNGARVLVLDEATSSLDSEAEKAVQEMIDELKHKISISIIAIAHRLSTIQKADMIYVLNNGAIIEQGDHNRLMKKNGLYSRLVELQNLGAISKE